MRINIKNLLFGIVISSLWLSACKKSDSKTPAPGSSVNINGKSYPTIQIGSLIWTSVNYDGPGGIAAGSNESLSGKCYSQADLSALHLPSGWRVPTHADFVALISYLAKDTTYSDGTISIFEAAKHLRATSGWLLNGDNTTGFNAYPNGSGNDIDEKGIAYFLGTTPSCSFILRGDVFYDGDPLAPIVQTNYLNIDRADIYLSNSTDETYGLRFVKDR